MSYNLLCNLIFLPLGMECLYRLTGPSKSRARLFHSGSHLPTLSLLLTEGPSFLRLLQTPLRIFAAQIPQTEHRMTKIQSKLTSTYPSHKNSTRRYRHCQCNYQHQKNPHWYMEDQVWSLPELRTVTASNCSYWQKPEKLPPKTSYMKTTEGRKRKCSMWRNREGW